MDSNTPSAPAPATRIPALEYHDSEYKGGQTIQMTTAWFLAQMQWLSDNGFKTLTGQEIIQFVEGTAQPPQKSVILRFDLGMPVYQNFHDVIIPALQKYGFHALFFALTSNIKDTNDNNHLCWSQLLEWEQAGLIEVGSHGVNHPDYLKADTNTRVWDAKESKRIIETKLSHPISFFSFPYDSVPASPESFLKPFGYRLAFAGYTRMDRSVQFKDQKPYALPTYYPYSSPSAYPRLTAANNLTFEQMIQAAIKSPNDSAAQPVTPAPAAPGSGSGSPSVPPSVPPPAITPPTPATPQRYQVTDLETGTTAAYTLNTPFRPLVFLPVPYVSQLGPGADAHNNDCGAAAAVMLLRAHLNLDLQPDDFYSTFGISGDPFLSAAQIRAALASRGIATDYRQNLAIQDLFAFLAASKPVIVLIRYQVFEQAGLTEKTLDGPHYSVVVGMDARNIYLHDPLYTRPADGEAHAYPLDLFWRAWKETASDPQFPNPERSAIIPAAGIGFRLARNVRINNSTLNVRSGPGLSFSVVKTLRRDEIVAIAREMSGWGEISGLGWISLTYTLPA